MQRLHKYQEMTCSLVDANHQEAKYQDVVEFNTLRLRQNGRHFAHGTFRCIFGNENYSILIKTSLKFVPKGPINNIRTLVQIMACRCPGDKPVSEPMMVSLLMPICVTRPQWVKGKQTRVYKIPFSSRTLSLRFKARKNASFWGKLSFLVQE